MLKRAHTYMDDISRMKGSYSAVQRPAHPTLRGLLLAGQLSLCNWGDCHQILDSHPAIFNCVILKTRSSWASTAEIHPWSFQTCQGTCWATSKSSQKTAGILDKEEQEPANLLHKLLDPFLAEKIGNGNTLECQRGGAKQRPKKGRGQIKLYFADMAAILGFHERFGAFPHYIIVAGVAPGTHYLDLVMIFPPSSEWHFYDTTEFHQGFDKEMTSMPNVYLYKKYYKTEEWKRWAGFRSVLLLSDIRTTTHHVLVKTVERLELKLHQHTTTRKAKALKREIQAKKFEIEQLILKRHEGSTRNGRGNRSCGL
jgi:hypothetical protein